jgi:tripartite-type tricarboxylate transporter receptor subunit TctC
MRINFLKSPVRALWAACVLATAALSAAAQDYPARPVRLIVPFPPGASTNDVLGRLIAQRLSESMGPNWWQRPRPMATRC